MCITFEGITFISKPPKKQSFDEKNRLHSKEGYAVEFEDGYGQHYINGVFFSEELFKSSFVNKSISSQEIMNLKNTENKACLIQHFGYEKILNELKDIKILDKQEIFNPIRNKTMSYELIEFPMGNKVIARFVKVEDFSTNKITCIGVPREESTNTCKKAISWTFPVKIYEPETET